MPPMPLLRCHHCNAPVHETVHTRTSYRVGYYDLHTGRVEPATRQLSEHAGPESYLRLVAPVHLVTCADCYARPAIQAEREALFYSENTGEADPDGSD